MTALTNITAPSRKLILTTIGLVVGAHLLTGGALSQITPTRLPPQKLPETKPIEIEMITLAPVDEEKAPEPEIIKQQEAETVVRRAAAPKVVKKPPTSTRQAVKPRERTQTQRQSTAKNHQPQRKVEKTQRATTTNAPTPQPTTTINNTQTITTNNQSSNNTTAMPSTNEGTIAQTSAAQLQAQQNAAAKREREEREERERQAAIKAEKDHLAAEAAAQAKRDRDAAAEKAARDAAAKQGPVALSASEASWRKPPNLGNISRAPVTLNATLKVDKKGNITSATVIGGDRKVNRAAEQRLRKAKLNPFMRGDMPVSGTVTLPIYVT